MIYQDDIVWRVGQSDLDMSFVDYVINLTNETIDYIRPTFRVFGNPTVDFANKTLIVAAPYSVQQQSKYEWYVYSADYLYSDGEPIEWSWDGLTENGYAYEKDGKLYIVSGIFMRDYALNISTFGNYAKLSSTRRTLDSFSISAIHTDSSEVSDVAGLYDEMRNPTFVIQSGSDVVVTNTDSSNVQTSVSVTADSVCNSTALKSNGVLSVESNTYYDSAEINTAINVTDSFVVGNYMFDSWGEVTINSILVDSYVYCIGKYDFITRCGKIYDRSGYGNTLDVFTDDLASMIEVIPESFDNSLVVSNVYSDRVVPCIASDTTIDCEGNPINPSQNNKVKMCIFLTT